MTVATIAAMVKFGRQIQSLKIGYDQNQRWTFLDKKNRKIVANKEGDCSAIAAGIAWLAGYPVDISGACFTGNLDVLMKRAGWKVLKYTKKSDVKTGDMVLAKGHHVVNALSKTEWLSAQSTEKGGRSGGAAGDQTGHEVVIRAPYERSGGWDYILRPPADAPVVPPDVVKPTKGIVVTASQLADTLGKVGSSRVRSQIRVRQNGAMAKTSLEELAALLTAALTGYKINSHAVAVFVATMLQESAWLATTVEYGTTEKSYDPYRGRTFEQLTHKDNYAGFGQWCFDNDLVPTKNQFVNHPEELGDLKWAWLGGTWYFDNRKLWDEAGAGDFQRVQTAVNLGTASTTRVPAGWTTRLIAYRAFLSAFDQPAKIDVDGDIGPKTVSRLQEFVGAAIDGELGSQTWFLIGRWLGIDGLFNPDNKGDVVKLQKKIGMDSRYQDGEWGPRTTKALQTYLNINR